MSLFHLLMFLKCLLKQLSFHSNMQWWGQIFKLVMTEVMCLLADSGDLSFSKTWILYFFPFTGLQCIFVPTGEPWKCLWNRKWGAEIWNDGKRYFLISFPHIALSANAIFVWAKMWLLRLLEVEGLLFNLNMPESRSL